MSRTLEELLKLRARVDGIDVRLGRIEGRVERVEGHVASLDDQMAVLRDGVVQLATEVVAMHGTLREVRDVLVERRADRSRLDDHELRIQDLEKKVG